MSQAEIDARDSRSPAHCLAQSLLDQDVRVRPSLWTDAREAEYGAALTEGLRAIIDQASGGEWVSGSDLEVRVGAIVLEYVAARG